MLSGANCFKKQYDFSMKTHWFCGDFLSKDASCFVMIFFAWPDPQNGPHGQITFKEVRSESGVVRIP